MATFDGDTAKEDRDYIRDTANIVRPLLPPEIPTTYLSV